MKKGINNKGFKAFPQNVQQNIVSNMRYGGRKYNKYNNGGPLLTEFNEGGSHEENPLGVVPLSPLLSHTLYLCAYKATV